MFGKEWYTQTLHVYLYVHVWHIYLHILHWGGVGGQWGGI